MINMKTFRTLQEVFSWKKEEIDGIRERIALAIKESEAHENMKSVLLEATGSAGKMIRPLMILMAAGDCPQGSREKILWGAAAGEMLHVASLLLDDIIDGAEMRRGVPSIQAKYGKQTALCAGNYLMVTAYSCLSSRGFGDVAAELMKVTQTVCDGEMIQDWNQWNTDLSEEIYMESIRKKTASVFAYACGIAARISGYDGETQERLAEFGETAGIMFQIRDDLLDWIRDEKALGKPSGEDFRNGIYTLPVIVALKDPGLKEELVSYAEKRRSIGPGELGKAKELIIRAGGMEYTRERIRELSEKASEILGKLRQSVYTEAFRLLLRTLTSDI